MLPRDRGYMKRQRKCNRWRSYAPWQEAPQNVTGLALEQAHSQKFFHIGANFFGEEGLPHQKGEKWWVLRLPALPLGLCCFPLCLRAGKLGGRRGPSGVGEGQFEEGQGASQEGYGRFGRQRSVQLFTNKRAASPVFLSNLQTSLVAKAFELHVEPGPFERVTHHSCCVASPRDPQQPRPQLSREAVLEERAKESPSAD